MKPAEQLSFPLTTPQDPGLPPRKPADNFAARIMETAFHIHPIETRGWGIPGTYKEFLTLEKWLEDIWVNVRGERIAWHSTVWVKPWSTLSGMKAQIVRATPQTGRHRREGYLCQPCSVLIHFGDLSAATPYSHTCIDCCRPTGMLSVPKVSSLLIDE